MRLLFCGSSFQCGLTTLLTEHALSLAQQPDCKLLMVFGEKEQQPGLRQKLIDAGIKFVVIPGFDEHGHPFRLASTINGIIRDFRPDWAMAQTNWQFLLLDHCRIFGRTKFKLIYWIHGYRNNYNFRSKIAIYLIGTVLKLRANKIVASSGIVFRKFLPFVGRRLIFSFLGVDDEFFDADCADLSQDNTKLIVFAGQFRHGKNQVTCLEAASILKQKGYCGFRFVLPGSGQLLAACRDEVASRGLADVVDLPGQYSRAEMIALYGRAFLAVVPSNNETFGSCISEPIVCGVPVASRPVGIAEDVIVNGVNGYIFHSAEELVNVISNLFADPTTYRSLKIAVSKSRALFRWDNICRKYLSELQ